MNIGCVSHVGKSSDAFLFSIGHPMQITLEQPPQRARVTSIEHVVCWDFRIGPHKPKTWRSTGLGLEKARFAFRGHVEVLSLATKVQF